MALRCIRRTTSRSAQNASHLGDVNNNDAPLPPLHNQDREVSERGTSDLQS